MSLIEIKQQLTQRDRVVFLTAWIFVFGGVAFWRWIQAAPEASSGVTLAFALLGLLLPSAAIFNHRAIDTTYRVLAMVTWPIGWIVAHVILALIYFGLVTPLGLVRRLLGHDPMGRRFDRQRLSYWSNLDENPEATTYFRPF